MITRVCHEFAYIVAIYQNNDLFVWRPFGSHVESGFQFINSIDDFLNVLDFIPLKIRECLLDFQYFSSDVAWGRYLCVGFLHVFFSFKFSIFLKNFMMSFTSLGNLVGISGDNLLTEARFLLSLLPLFFDILLIFGVNFNATLLLKDILSTKSIMINVLWIQHEQGSRIMMTWLAALQ